MDRWSRPLPLLLLLASVLPLLATRSQQVAGPGPKVIPQYRLKLEAKDTHGNALPATMVVSSIKTKLSLRKSLADGPLILNLRSGDVYEVEASYDGFQTVKKTLRLDRLGDPARTNLLVTLELPAVRVPLQVSVVDDRTGKPIQGFWMKTEDGDPNQFTESQFMPESSAKMLVDPGRPVRVVVKAEGYAIQSHEIADSRFVSDVTLRLRPLEEWAVRPYSVRVIDSDYQHLRSQYDVQVRDELMQPVPLQHDQYTNDWQVLLKQRGQYTIEVQAPGYVPYRDTLRNVPQSTILVMLHRRVTNDDARQSLSMLNGTGRGVSEARPAYYAQWVEKLYPSGRQSAAKAGRTDQNLLTLDKVYFDQGKDEIRADSYEQLRQLVDLLTAYPALKLKIAGHTDRLGDPKLNFFLSDQRAGAVYHFLVDRGIDPKRLRFQGYGHSRPLAPSDTEENRQKNRRVEVWVTEK